MGGDSPNAADLQIAPTIRLMLTIADVRPLIDGRPCGELARELFPDWDGDQPAGVFPPDWLPAPAATPAS
jgi:glutathione S-transferase